MNISLIRKQAQRHVSLIGMNCSQCNSTQNLHRHHHDYNKPLEVEILCATCHGRQHAIQRWAGHSKQRNCAYCQMEFTYKRARQRTCSLSCANKLAWVARHGGKSSQTSAEPQPKAPIGHTSLKP